MAKTNAKTAHKAPKTARTKKAAAARQSAPKGRPTKATAVKKGSASANAQPESKQAMLIARMQRKDGATIAELVRATGWQAHSVRGAISGTLKKKLGLAVSSEKIEGRGRVYRIATGT
jgi:hypothetical protein